MFGQLKSILQLMGHGLAHQDLGEMSPTADKITQIEKRSKNYQLLGGQSRIVLIVSIDPVGPAFDFVAELAKQTGSLIEVLYISPANEAKSSFETLLSRLGNLACDFQITFLTDDLFLKISDYSSQRQDIIAVVCSNTEILAEKLRSSPQMINPLMSTKFPDILLVGGSIMA